MIKLGMRLVRFVSVAYTILASVLVVVEVLQSLGREPSEVKPATPVEKTRKRKQIPRAD